MSALAEQQQALLQVLFGPWSSDALAGLLAQDGERRVRGLQAYRSNARVLAPRVLGAAYPVVRELLAEEGFTALAVAHWCRHPPQRGDLTQWGADLAAHIALLPELDGEPYLGDVARVEWALHLAATAPDQPADPASWHLLVQEDPARLGLRTASGLCLVRSTWPVVSIVKAHQGQPAGLQEAARLLRAGVAECALIWRHGFKPMLRAAQAFEPALLESLQAGESLPEALQRAAVPDFSHWLAAAVSEELLGGVTRLPA